MSLELAIAENTRALNQLISILRDQAANPVPVAENSSETAASAAEDPPKTKRTKKEAAKEPVGQPVQEETAPSPEPGATDAQETAAAATATELSYADAAAAVTALINANGRADAVKLLKQFNAKNLKEVDPSQYRNLIDTAREMAVPF